MPARSRSKRIVTLLVAGMVALGACSGPELEIRNPDETENIDLADPALLARLGVPEPNIEWQRSIDRLSYAGSGSAPLEAEVDLVARVIDDIPTALFSKLDVRWVIRDTTRTAARPNHPSAVAFAIGPDIYLLDRAFALSDGGSTRYDLERAVAHELVHIAQFQTMDAAYVAAALTGELDQLNPIDGSSLVKDFADSTGWVNTSSNPLHPEWQLGSGLRASSEYGATDPGEDMAEAVSLVVLGLSELLPETHVRWVEGWLGSPADALALGQPWAPAGSMEVLSENALYDVTAVAAAQGSLSHAEAIYFQLPQDVPEGALLVDLIEARLRTRVMSGTLDVLPVGRVPRYGGRFSGPGGRLWWVELWDFREATPGTSGPRTPILVYVAIW